MTWNYQKEKEKYSCAICGEETTAIGMALPLCHRHEIEWLASPERAERAAARQRFIDRMKRARRP
jgi:hypothetical protein